jgi:hypothetical protein
MVDELELRKQKLREAYKRAYLSPFRLNQAIVDPALLRYESARQFSREYFKITPRSLIVPLLFGVAVVSLQLHLNNNKRILEEDIENGNATYADRALYKAKFLS